VVVSLRDLEHIVETSRSKRFRIVVRFRDTKYLITIDGEIKATDINGSKVPWSRAFQQPPHVVLSTYKIDRIDVMCGDNLVASYGNLNDLVKSMDKHRC
jgi:hypothetical protein